MDILNLSTGGDSLRLVIGDAMILASLDKQDDLHCSTVFSHLEGDTIDVVMFA
jgi:hypothetical protein